MADDETSMACSLADRENDFEGTKPILSGKTKRVIPKVIITTSDEEEDFANFAKKK